MLRMAHEKQEVRSILELYKRLGGSERAGYARLCNILTPSVPSCA